MIENKSKSYVCEKKDYIVHKQKNKLLKTLQHAEYWSWWGIIDRLAGIIEK